MLRDVLTRFIWDKFSKDLIETLLSPYGQVNPSKEVASEVKKIDLWFTPNAPDLPDSLGLLGKLSQTPCLIEPYRNAINQDDILDCLHRQLTVRGLLRRKAKREGRRLSKDEIPFVWILTPTASKDILNSFVSQLTPQWGQGIYVLPEPFRAGVVVIHQLPEIPETLWLRLMGKGRKRDRAVNEVEAMSPDNLLKSETQELLYNVTKNLEAASDQTQEDREFIMRLAPLYQQEREQTLQQGKQEEASSLVLRQLQRRFGEIPQNIQDTIRELSVQRLEDLGLALLDFNSQDELIDWLG